jgi:DNA-binding CsgD family transcriptional regulator
MTTTPESFDGLLPPDQLPAAVAAMTAAKGWQAGLELETAHWDRYISSHPEALLASISSLPGDAFVAMPSLLVAVNYLRHLIAGGDPRSFHDFAHDDSGKASAERESIDLLIGSAGRTAGHRTQGQLTEAVSAASEGRRLLDGLSPRHRPQVQMSLPHLLIQWGRSFELVDAGGVREYEEAWELANLTGQMLIARRAAASLAWLHADHGRLGAAETWIARAADITAEGQRYDAPLYLAQAMVAVDRLDHAGATAHLARLSEAPVGEYWAAEIRVRSWIARSADDAVRVERLVDEQRLSRPRPLVVDGANGRYISSALARLAVLRNRPSPRTPETPEPTPTQRILRTSAAYREGRMHDVLHEGSMALTSSTAPRIQAYGQMLIAAARLGLGRRDAAVAAFLSARDAIESERLYSGYAVIARDHLLMLETLSGIELPAQLASLDAEPHAGAAGSPAVLSRRERQLLVELASNRSLAEIADALFVSHNTVKTTTGRLYRKLGVHSRKAAVDVAHRMGLV